MGSATSGSRVARLEAVQSGAATGPVASLLRGLLSLASGGYCLGRFLHRGLYETGLRARRRLPQPVVSVGNLTAGGAGKTPVVAWLAAQLLARGSKPAVLARGYGRGAGESLNEEGRWLSETVPGVPVLQGADRHAVARHFLRSGTCDLFVLDDGFQHERLSRDLDLVLVDGLRPFGHGHRLPRGLLRDPPQALQRADTILVTRAELLDDRAREALAANIARLAPGLPVSWVRFEVREVEVGGERRPAADLVRRSVLMACAVGNPESVRRTLVQLQAEVVEEQVFRDHHAYTEADARLLVEQARALDAVVVLTEKDHVKLRDRWPDAPAPWVLHQSVEVEGGEELLGRIEERIRRRAETVRSASES